MHKALILLIFFGAALSYADSTVVALNPQLTIRQRLFIAAKIAAASTCAATGFLLIAQWGWVS